VGFTHEPAIELAHKLVNITPKALAKVFFVDNSSSAVDVALKMSYHYHLNKGKRKAFFLSLTNSYHGETEKVFSFIQCQRDKTEGCGHPNRTRGVTDENL
jgi:adenosylmethionine-8-amino-7-oxononanoate aminotransferase